MNVSDDKSRSITLHVRVADLRRAFRRETKIRGAVISSLADTRQALRLLLDTYQHGDIVQIEEIRELTPGLDGELHVVFFNRDGRVNTDHYRNLLTFLEQDLAAS